MSTIDCDRCGTTVEEQDIHTDDHGNTLCRDCWQRSEDLRVLAE